MPEGQTNQSSVAATPALSGTAQATPAALVSNSSSQRSSASPTRPDWAPEAAWKDTGLDLEAFGKYYGESIAPKMTAWAADQAKRSTLPQKPEDVQIAFPKDWQPPPGSEFKIDASRPEAQKFRETVVKYGIPQEAASELLAVYGTMAAGDEASLNAARAAEVAKLGANGAQRVDAINTFFTGLIGPDGARQIGSMLATAGIVQAVEKAIAKFATQGVGNFSQAHRDPAGGGQGRLTSEQYNALPASRRLDYARTLDQSQFQRAG